MPTEVFVEQIQFTSRVISLNTENITREESLVFRISPAGAWERRPDKIKVDENSR